MIIIHFYTNKIALKFTLLKTTHKNDRIVLKVLKFSNMFRSIFDHPQGDIFFTSVTKDKLIRFVVACLLYLCFVLMLLRALRCVVVAVLQQPHNGEHATTSTQSTTSITGMLPQTR